MASEPEQLERQIGQTREQLGRDMDALAEKVSPRAAARRRFDRVKSAATSIRENVMGSTGTSASTKASEWGHSIGDTASSAKHSVASAKDSVAESVQGATESVTGAAHTATQKVRRGATGNPMAAGVIAFGVGWLASSWIPVSRTEQQLGQTIRTSVKEQGSALGNQLSSAASEVAENLREPARDAADQVQRTAADAAGAVKDQAQEQAAGAGQERTQQPHR